MRTPLVSALSLVLVASIPLRATAQETVSGEAAQLLSIAERVRAHERYASEQADTYRELLETLRPGHRGAQAVAVGSGLCLGVSTLALAIASGGTVVAAGLTDGAVIATGTLGYGAYEAGSSTWEQFERLFDSFFGDRAQDGEGAPSTQTEIALMRDEMGTENRKALVLLGTPLAPTFATYTYRGGLNWVQTNTRLSRAVLLTPNQVETYARTVIAGYAQSQSRIARDAEARLARVGSSYFGLDQFEHRDIQVREAERRLALYELEARHLRWLERSLTRASLTISEMVALEALEARDRARAQGASLDSGRETAVPPRRGGSNRYHPSDR